ncbi:RNA polymerase sigma factor [Streptomyces olivaceus]
MPSTTRSTASGCPGTRPSPATTPAATPGTSCAPPSWPAPPHRDGRPELGGAAFDTVILQNLTDPAAYANELTETLELFTAISRLPHRQLDVIVLRRLCGFTHEAASALLGTSLAAIRSDERHATRFLDSVIPPSRTEGTTP